MMKTIIRYTCVLFLISTAAKAACFSGVGKYNTDGNNFYFLHATDNDCLKVTFQYKCDPNMTWICEKFGYPIESAPLDFILDSNTHERTGKDFVYQAELLNIGNLLVKYYPKSNPTQLQATVVYATSSKPCNLMNPNGSSYLVKQQFNAQGIETDCSFWSTAGSVEGIATEKSLIFSDLN